MYSDIEHSLLSEILDEIEGKYGKFTGRSSREFVTRLSTNFGVLRDLFMSLYDQRKDREKRFRQLIVSLYSKYLRRPKNLRHQDKANEVDHQWLLNQQWVGMTLYLENFAKDLSGIRKRISYLEELGINLVHLMSVPKTLPKKSELRSLAKKLRKRDMLIILDLALNHTSQQHKWAKKGDLNYSNPRVLIKMASVLLDLANQGADIFRLETQEFHRKEMGTDSQNLQQSHTILKILKRCTEVVAPGVKLIAKGIVPGEVDAVYHNTLMALIWESLATTKVDLFKKSIGKLPVKPKGTTWINYLRCHQDMDFGFDDEEIYQIGFDAKLHRAFLLEYYTGRFQGSNASGIQSMLDTTNNDVRISGTLASLAGLEKSLEQHQSEQIAISIQRIVLAHAVIMSFGGLPMIYSGDEIGQLNDYSYKNDQAKSKDNRWMHRPVMDWKSAKKRSDQETIQHSIFTALQKLILIRKNSPEWADLNSCKLAICENQHILAYLRSQEDVSGDADQGSQTLVLANFHPSVQYIKDDILSRYGFDIKRGVIDKYTEKVPKYYKDLLEFQPYQFYFITDKANY